VSTTVRMARADDTAVLVALFAEGDRLHAAAQPVRFRYVEPEVTAWRQRQLATILPDPDQPIFVAERDGFVAGAIRLTARTTPGTPVTLPRRFILMQELVVREPFRRSGVGRALLEQVHQWASAHGIREIELNVFAFNVAALAFYSAMGYTVFQQRLSRTV
jgi:diamine N-acetyltransferase